MNRLEKGGRAPCTVLPDCLLPTDITLISSDGKRFPTHSQNLGQFTSGFPLGITPATGEEVHMPELDSKALRLFLCYVHPNHRQPCLDQVRFKTVIQLAEAVEKYEVFSATEVCRLRISRYANHPSRCVDIFEYASKHEYRKLMDDTAFIAVQSKQQRREMEACNLRGDIREAWNRYTESWRGLFVDCYNPPPPVPHKGGVPECKLWRKFKNVVVSDVKQEAIILSSFGSIVNGARHYLEDCKPCGRRADIWIANAYKDILVLKKFSSYVYY